MKTPIRISILATALCLPVAMAQDAVNDNKVTTTSADIEVEAKAPATEATPNLEAADGEPEESTEASVDRAAVKDTIAQRVAASDGLTRLNAAIQAAGFDTKLGEEGPYTLLAPTDAVFDSISDAEFKKLLLPGNRERLTALLERHLLDGIVTADELETESINTVSGETIMVIVEDEAIEIGGANVTMDDYLAGNGVIHMIDGFVQTVPSSAPGAGDAKSTASTTVVGGGSVVDVEMAEDTEEVGEEVREEAEDAREDAEDAAEDAREDAEDAAEEARGDAEDAAEDIRDHAEEVVEEVEN